MDLVLGIDLGTSYFKLGVFDRSGELRGLGRVAVQTDTEVLEQLTDTCLANYAARSGFISYISS